VILIDDIIVSDQIVEEYFHCDLSKCKGVCCVEGETGAPLEDEELPLLKSLYPLIKKYLTEEGKGAIRKQGYFVKGKKGNYNTPLVDGKACAYIHYENGIAKCGIEKAYEEGEITFQKPLSCHLYPIRVTATGEMQFVNYDEWEICNAACDLGKMKKLPLYKFLKAPLIRKFGKETYEALEASAEHLSKDVTR